VNAVMTLNVGQLACRSIARVECNTKLFAQYFSLSVNAAKCFGLKSWPSSGSCLRHVQPMFLLTCWEIPCMIKIIYHLMICGIF
jgi:hypothetical protein